MPAPVTLPLLDDQLLDGLQRSYECVPDAETRIRYQMILLARSGYTAPQIACIVLRSEDTVARVLKRFLTGGSTQFPSVSHQAESALSQQSGKPN